MNNQKQQALDALTGLDRVSNGMLSVHKNELATLRNFIESVESVDLFTTKKTIIDFTSALRVDLSQADVRDSVIRAGKSIPDTLNTSCRCDDLQSQLEAERTAHAETRAQLELAHQAETRALQGWHDDQTKSDELPTKAERLAEMQRIADYVNNGGGINNLSVENYESGKLVYCCGVVRIGNGYEYKPEPVAPAKNDPVYFCSIDTNKTKTGISSGHFNDDGCLEVAFFFDLLSDGLCILPFENWCSISDRSNHSPGWKREWEPDYAKKSK